MSRPTARACCLVLAAALVLAAGRAHADAREEPLLVFAAASLTDVLPKVVAQRPTGAAQVVFSFDASSKLARQIDAGAPAAVVVTADAEWMDELERHGRLVMGTRVDLVGNHLVLVVPKGAMWKPASARALAADTSHRLAIAGEAVPAGRYGRAALAAAGALDRVKPRLVVADNVRAALAWVARGEADGAIVYATDARVEPRVEVAFVFDPATHPRIVYPAAVVRGRPTDEPAKQLVAWLRSAAARRTFAAAGFDVPASVSP